MRILAGRGRLLLPPLVVCLAACGAFAKDDGKKPDAADSEKATLLLQAVPRYGFRPLEVTLYARLEGVPQGDRRFCHAGVEWIGESRAGRVMRSTEDARCIHPDDLTRVDHSYSKRLELYRPGIYRYYVKLHLKDGGEIRSNTVDVRVLDNR